MSDQADDGTLSWRTLLNEATTRFAAGGLPDSAISARRIVEQAAGFEPTEFALGLDQPATVRGVAQFDSMVKRRLLGEPLQYVVGNWGFRTLDLCVDRRVLIPRPETEEVVQWGMGELGRVRANGLDHPIVADLGTGSGAIGLSILAEITDAQVWLTDYSEDALQVARANLAGLGSMGARGRVACGSWFEALPNDLRSSLTLIIANPPYVAASDRLPPVVAEWEPLEALVAGPKGTEDVEHLLAEARHWVFADGAIVVEMAPSQVEAMAELASNYFAEVETRSDLSGRDRAVIARYPRRCD